MEQQGQNFDNNIPLKKTVTRSDNFLVILLSILLVLASLIAVFFGLQKQKLANELQEIRNEKVVEIESTPNPTIDAMTGWETYANTEYNFSIKYPSNYKLLTNKESLYGWPNAVALIYSGGQSYDLPIEIWSDKNEYKQKYSTLDEKYITMVSILNNKYLTLVNLNENEIVDKIISTFKFTEPEATSSSLPVACTMEAKICPDGSAVGRSGPNCEFAPCPTPKP